MMPLAGDMCCWPTGALAVPQLSSTDPAERGTCPSQVMLQSPCSWAWKPASSSSRIAVRLLRACRKLCQLTNPALGRLALLHLPRPGSRSASSVSVPPEREKIQELMRSRER
jgi:hypothetical protein